MVIIVWDFIVLYLIKQKKKKVYRTKRYPYYLLLGFVVKVPYPID